MSANLLHSDRATPDTGRVGRNPAGLRQRGFTLIELLVVMAIMAVLAVLAVPSFVGLIASSNVSRAVNAFVSDTRYARGEGMRRGKSVTICRTSTPSAAAPACSGGDGLAVGAWREGWVVFVDADGDGSFDAADDSVLRIQEASGGISGLFAVAAGSSSAVATRNFITYDATGRAIGQQARWLLYASGSFVSDSTYSRTLCMNSVGRVRVLPGEVAC